jgi:hypothetical protein
MSAAHWRATVTSPGLCYGTLGGNEVSRFESGLRSPNKGENMKKSNCYDCKHKGIVPGDAHSSCQYPGTKTGILDHFAPENIKLRKQLNIKGHEQGLRRGWFLWPINFDPVWLINCDGFEAK